jgi:hypothetical protein
MNDSHLMFWLLTVGALCALGCVYGWRDDLSIVWANLKWRFRGHKEGLQWAIATRMPRWLCYYCAIRVAVHATTGIHSKTEAPGVTIADMLKRWGKPN